MSKIVENEILFWKISFFGFKGFSSIVKALIKSKTDDFIFKWGETTENGGKTEKFGNHKNQTFFVFDGPLNN